MEDPEPLEYPMYQALWRTKHNAEDALAIEWPDAPILFFIYRCAEAAESHEVKELAVQETPAEDTTVVGWFFQMDRDHVKRICTSEAKPADAQNPGDWARAVTEVLLEKQLIFWKGDSKTELVSFGALDEDEAEEEEEEEGQEHEQEERQENEQEERQEKGQEDENEEDQEGEQEEGQEEVYNEELDEEQEEGEIDESITAESIISEPPRKTAESERAIPTETNQYEVDEITYDSCSEGGLDDDMEIDWF